MPDPIQAQPIEVAQVGNLQWNTVAVTVDAPWTTTKKKKPKTVKGFHNRHFFLSSFYPCTITYYGVTYPSAQHAFEAQKFPADQRTRIAALPTARKAKEAGRKIPLPVGWETTYKGVAVPKGQSPKEIHMWNIVQLKFAPATELGNLLLSTWGQTLYNINNWHDNFWGQCWCEPCGGVKKHDILSSYLVSQRTILMQAVTNFLHLNNF